MGEHEVRKRAVFLDRDGVLNRPVVRDGHPFPPMTLEEFEVYPDVVDACAELKAAGFLLIVVTNQPDVGRGTQTRDAVDAIHVRLRAAIPSLDAIEVCFHAGAAHGEPCDCRKPKPGMLLRAARAHAIDLRQSFLIGDRWRDIDCAHAAGCRAIFIERGYQEELREKPELTVSNFADATRAILNFRSTGNGRSNPESNAK
jgi:D-glycero-D-manno-heptose 1,7-bisphosphate phosphatase